MSKWAHTFTPEMIGSTSTITGLRPFRLTAEALTEIQSRVVTDVEISIADGEPTASIVDGTLKITIPSSLLTGSDDLLPEGGEDGDVLQRDAYGVAYWGPVRAK